MTAAPVIDTAPGRPGRLDVAFFPGGVTDTWPQSRSPSWPTLAAWLTRFRVHTGDKEQAPMWSPARFRPGGRRCAATVEWVSLLVLDYDGGTAPEEAAAAFHDVPHGVHTTWSHTDEAPKFRLVVPLAEPVPAGDWKYAWEWARSARPTGASTDPKCKDPGRAYFGPVVRNPEWPRVAWIHDDGGPFWRLEYGDDARRCREAAEAESRERRAWGERMRRHVLPGRKAEMVARLLRTDPASRERAAARLDARIVTTAEGQIARGIPCPACGRPGAWFFIDPRRMTGAACNHLNSCGWRGSLYGLCVARLGRVDG